jgi:hypothetical protein
MSESEWDLLPYTKLPMGCNHCGNKTPMKIVIEKAIAENYVAYFPEYGDVPMGYKHSEWKILQCPLCKKIIVTETITTDDYEADGYDDETGVPLSTPDVNTTILYPISDIEIPDPNPNMPSEIAADFTEAKRIFPFSARSSAALLRLSIQKLCKHLGEKGKNINDDIKALVKKGLPLHIQQALDIVRVIGNESVHPGEINVNDTPEIAKKLFDLVNEIVDDRIGKFTKQAEIDKLYRNLPENKLEEIRKRDGNGSVP